MGLRRLLSRSNESGYGETEPSSCVTPIAYRRIRCPLDEAAGDQSGQTGVAVGIPPPGPLSILGRSPGGARSSAERALQGSLFQSGHSGKVPVCSDFSFPSPGARSPGPGPSLGGNVAGLTFTGGPTDHSHPRQGDRAPVPFLPPQEARCGRRPIALAFATRLADAGDGLRIYRWPSDSPQRRRAIGPPICPPTLT